MSSANHVKDLVEFLNTLQEYVQVAFGENSIRNVSNILVHVGKADPIIKEALNQIPNILNGVEIIKNFFSVFFDIWKDVDSLLRKLEIIPKKKGSGSSITLPKHGSYLKSNREDYMLSSSSSTTNNPLEGTGFAPVEADENSEAKSVLALIPYELEKLSLEAGKTYQVFSQDKINFKTKSGLNIPKIIVKLITHREGKRGRASASIAISKQIATSLKEKIDLLQENSEKDREIQKLKDEIQQLQSVVTDLAKFQEDVSSEQPITNYDCVVHYVHPELLVTSPILIEKNQERWQEIEKWLQQPPVRIVAFMGNSHCGKTFLINKFVGTNLPCSKVTSTNGISFIAVEHEKKRYLFIDCPAMDVPIQNISKCFQKAQEESYIRDVILEIADFVIYVVNEMTLKEQVEIYTIAERLSMNKTERFQDIIVIHNWKNLKEQFMFEHQIHQTKIIYEPQKGQIESSLVKLENAAAREVQLLLVDKQKHLFLGSYFSPYFQTYNPYVLENLKNIISSSAGYNRSRNLNVLLLSAIERTVASHYKLLQQFSPEEILTTENDKIEFSNSALQIIAPQKSESNSATTNSDFHEALLFLQDNGASHSSKQADSIPFEIVKDGSYFIYIYATGYKLKSQPVVDFNQETIAVHLVNSIKHNGEFISTTRKNEHVAMFKIPRLYSLENREVVESNSGVIQLEFKLKRT